MSGLKIILAVDAIRPPLTGIARYAFELARGLQNHPDIDQLQLLDRLRWIQAKTLSLSESSPEVLRANTRPSHPNPMRRALGRMALPALRWARCLPYRDHVFHNPNYALPPFPGKSVSTLHDLSVLRHPEFHPEERVRHLAGLFPTIVKRADLLLTDSEFSRREILDCLKVDPERVLAIPLGVDAGFLAPPSPSSTTLERHGLRPQGYVLSIGTIEPRKNLLRLIEAYETLPAPLRQECPLVLAGSEGWKSSEIHQKIREAERSGWLRYLSFVAEEDLVPLYGGARLFVCVSLYEGFGLPVLEAMASGTPVIASDAASLPEVIGDAGRLVDPTRTEAIRTALLETLEDESQLKSMGERGQTRAAAFTWEATIERTVSAYRRID